MFDSHTHTCNSHDSRQTIDDLCQSAIAKGCRGIAVTDHADMWYCTQRDTLHCIQNSIIQTQRAAERYQGQLQVFRGIELSEYLFDWKTGNQLLELTDYDVILGSVHCVKTEDWEDAYSCIRFDNNVPEEKIDRLLQSYFEQMQLLVNWGGFDVLTHLTCPLRYITGKYNRAVDISKFLPQISKILETIIRKEIALEINTSWFYGNGGELMPDRKILTLYKDWGGELITLGSDAHVPENVAGGFGETMALLKSLGFTHYNYYKNHQPQQAMLK